MKTYKSDEILAMEYLPEEPFKYQLTDDEWQWQRFVAGRYSIADYVYNNTQVDDNGNLILHVDQYEFSIALDEDNCGVGKATMLSDDTALQKIFFFGYIEDIDNES